MRQITAAAALIVLLGACTTSTGSDGVASANGGSNAPTTSKSAQGSEAEQNQKFAQCMRDNGVDVPDPGPDGKFGDWGSSGIDRSSPAFQKAMEACQDELPGGGDPNAIDPKTLDELRLYTQCLRDNGINVSDPDPASPNLGMEEMQTIDRESPAFKKAEAACKDKLPEGFGQ